MREINRQSESPTDAISNTARNIAHIRAVTKISVSELSRVFGVSRQVVHEWIKGGALLPRNALSLSALAQATDTFLEAGIDVTPQVFRRKVAGGPSILEAVRENGNVVELARTLASTLVRESQQRQRLAARLAGRLRPTFLPQIWVRDHLIRLGVNLLRHATLIISPAEYAATTRAKREATKSGKQFAKQPKNVAAKVARYR